MKKENITKNTKRRKKLNSDKIDYKNIDKIANILSPSREDYMEELSLLGTRFRG